MLCPRTPSFLSIPVAEEISLTMSQTHANHDSASPVPHHDSKSKMDQELFWSIYDDRAQKRSKKDLEELSEDLDAHLTFVRHLLLVRR